MTINVNKKKEFDKGMINYFRYFQIV